MSTTHLRIGPADHGRRMSLDEFLDAEETPGYRYELARGVLEVTRVPNDSHGYIVHRLYAAFYAYYFQHPGVIDRIGGSGEFQIWIPGMRSGRNPDVAVVFRNTPLDDKGKRRPSLVVEVVSPGGELRDYETKSEEYLTFGILEYWIVDPFKRSVTVLTREVADGPVRWAETRVSGVGTIPSRLLMGLDVTVADLWRDVERDEIGE